MFSYFTELNRKRVPAEQLDFITHCTCPIVHAADDLSVMQSLEALPFITRSVARSVWRQAVPDRPVDHCHAPEPLWQRDQAQSRRARIAMAERDPRHAGLFAAAWAVGYAARVVSAGLEQLTLSGFAGPFGLLAGEGEPVAKGQARPLFHVVQGLGGDGRPRHPSQAKSSDEDRIAALAARSPDGRLVLWLANLTADEVLVRRPDLPCASVAILDARSVQAAEGFRSVDPRRELRLGAYAVARIG